MKKQITILLLFIATIASAQTIDVAGSAPTSGAIQDFYYDAVDDLLYGIGPFTNAGGQAVQGMVAWNGSDWVAKGDVSLLGGARATGTDNSIMRNGDTLYAMAATMTHPENFGMSMLMYWDKSVSNWKNKTYGVFGNEYHLVSYNDTLFIVGNVSGGLDLSEASALYAGLGNMAYWNGSRWIKYASAPSFWSNPKGAVVVNGVLYIEDYKYQAGVWTKVTGTEGVESIGKWGNKVVYCVKEGGNYNIKTYDGTTITTIGVADARVDGIAEYGSKLAVCGIGLGDINGTTVKKIASFDGTTWETLFAPHQGGTGVRRVGGYHNQLIASAENGGFYDTKAIPVVSYGSTVLIGGSLTVDVKTLEGSSLTIYPNPTNSQLNFSTTCDLVQVYSVNGSELLSVQNTNSIDVSDLASGMYYITITAEGTVTNSSFLKQ